jgi:hypothetical protein
MSVYEELFTEYVKHRLAGNLVEEAYVRAICALVDEVRALRLVLADKREYEPGRNPPQPDLVAIDEILRMTTELGHNHTRDWQCNSSCPMHSDFPMRIKTGGEQV